VYKAFGDESKKRINMAVSKEMIEQSRENVAHTLVEYFEATEHELICFENKLVTEHGVDSWTSGFADELLPMFLEVRNELNNKVWNI